MNHTRSSFKSFLPILFLLLCLDTVQSRYLRWHRGNSKTGSEESNLAPIQSSCPLTAEVTCFDLKDGKSCDDIPIRPGRCETHQLVFNFKYCNTLPSHRKGYENKPITEVIGDISLNQGNLLSEHVLDSDLETETCRVLKHVVDIDGCAHTYQGDIKLVAYSNDELLCDANGYFRHVRPLFKSTH